MEYETLDDIFADDPFGILELKEKAKPATSDERLATSFEEISVFIDENGRFISPDLMIAVLGHYFLEERGERGKVLQDIRSSKSVGEYLVPIILTGLFLIP